MNTRIDPDDVVLLRRAGLTEEDLAHSILVAGIVGELLDAMPKEMREGLDERLAVRGALFHDLGKVVTSGITHGEEGARIGRELGLPQEVLAVMVKHVRAGVPPDEATHYGLPPGDRRVTRLEEALAIYADKLSDIMEEPGLVEDLTDARGRFAEILAARADLAKDEVTRGRYLRLREMVEAKAGG